MTRQRFLYKCVDCGWQGRFGLYEFARRCRPHCQECGCTLLDPVTKEAKDRIGRQREALREQRDRLDAKDFADAAAGIAEEKT